MMLRAEFRRLFERRHIRVILEAVCALALLYGFFLHYAAERADTGYIHYQQEYLLENWNNVLGERKMTLEAQKDSVLFNDPSEQAAIRGELEVIGRLETIKLKEVNDSIFHEAVRFNRYAAVIFILIGLILIQDLFIEDRDEDLCVLYSTVPVSGLRQGFCRAVVLLSVYAMICVLFLSVQLVCLGDLCRLPVQNISGFSVTNGTWTAAGAAVILFSFAALSALSVITVCLLAVMITGKTGLGLTIAAAAGFGEYLIAVYMSVTSRFAFLKTWNPVTWMMCENIPDGFTVLAGRALAEPYAVLLVLAILSFTFLFFCRLVFTGHERRASSWRMNFPLIRIRRMTAFHLRELLIEKRGLAVILLTVGFCLAQMLNYKVIRTPVQAGFEVFRSAYYGRIDDILLARIENDRHDIHAAREKADRLYLEWTDGGSAPERLSDEQRQTLSKLMETGSHSDHIDAVYDEVLQLKEASADYYLNMEGLELLAGKNNLSVHLYNFFLSTLPVLILAAVFAHSGLRSLFCSTVVSEGGILRNKYILMCMCAMLMTAAVYGAHALKIIRHYDVRFSGTVRQFGIGMELPVWLYLVLYPFNVICIQFTLIRVSMYFARIWKPAAAAGAVCGIAAAGAVMPLTGFILSWMYPADPVRYVLFLSILLIVNICSPFKNTRKFHGCS